MKCQYCGAEVPTIIKFSISSEQGLLVCGNCYQELITKRHQPYSKTIKKYCSIIRRDFTKTIRKYGGAR